MLLFIIDELLLWELFWFETGFFTGVGNNLMLEIMTLHVNERLANLFWIDANWCLIDVWTGHDCLYTAQKMSKHQFIALVFSDVP